MTRLRRRMLEDLRILNYSPRTVDTYVKEVAKFARFFGRSPEQLGIEQIRAYQVFLVEERKLSYSSLNIAVCALRFLYDTTLGRDVPIERIRYAKKPHRLPVILSPQEVARVLGALDNVKHRAILATIYSAGLRVSEASHLRVSDIDSARMLLRVEQGKGRKDRYVALSPRLLIQLRQYWREVRPQYWLFPGQDPERPISIGTVECICREAGRRAGVKKKVTPHQLRHCFATHSLEAGVNLRVLQVALGHKNLQTTSRYTHVAKSTLASQKSPLDQLPPIR